MQSDAKKKKDKEPNDDAVVYFSFLISFPRMAAQISVHIMNLMYISINLFPRRAPLLPGMRTVSSLRLARARHPDTTFVLVAIVVMVIMIIMMVYNRVTILPYDGVFFFFFMREG